MGAIGRYGVGTSKLLTTDQVCAKVGLTASTWRAYVDQGKAPQPAIYVSLGSTSDLSYARGGRDPLWNADMVEAWLHGEGGVDV